MGTDIGLKGNPGKSGAVPATVSADNRQKSHCGYIHGKAGRKNEARARRPALHRYATLSSGVERWKRAGSYHQSVVIRLYRMMCVVLILFPTNNP